LSQGQVKVLQVEPAHVGGAVIVVLECDGGEQDPGRDATSDHHVLGAVQKTVSWNNLLVLEINKMSSNTLIVAFQTIRLHTLLEPR